MGAECSKRQDYEYQLPDSCRAQMLKPLTVPLLTTQIDGAGQLSFSSMLKMSDVLCSLVLSGSGFCLATGCCCPLPPSRLRIAKLGPGRAAADKTGRRDCFSSPVPAAGRSSCWPPRSCIRHTANGGAQDLDHELR